MSSRILVKQKPSHLIIAVLAAFMAIAGIYIVLSSHAASGETANLWVNTSAGASPTRCAAECFYDSSKPFGSLNDAYQAASPGDKILVKSGNYGDQNIRYDTSKTSQVVVIKSEGGSTPVLGKMGVEASYVSVLGPFKSKTLETNGTAGRQITNVLVQDFTVDHGGINDAADAGYIASIKDSTWKNINICCTLENPGMITDGGYNNRLENITLDNVTVHDVWIAQNSLSHVACIGMFGGWNITIKNSHFYRCTTFDLFITYNDDQAIPTRMTKNLTVENSVFEDTYGSGIPPNDLCCSYSNIQFRVGGPTADGAIFRNNTLSGNLSVRSDTNWSIPPKFIGNLLSTIDCIGNGVVYSHNVGENGCGSSDKVFNSNAINAGFVNPAGHDYRLTSTSPAIGGGDPTNYPAQDIIGISRGAIPDAGAYAFSSSSPPPPPPPTCTKAADINCDGSVNIQDVTVVLSNFGKPVAQASDPRADASGNGSVDIPDMTVVLSAFGT